MATIIIVSKKDLAMDVNDLQKEFKEQQYFETHRILNLANVYVFYGTCCDTEQAHDLMLRLKNSATDFVTVRLKEEEVRVIGIDEHHDFMDEMLENTSSFAEWEDRFENDSLYDDLTRGGEYHLKSTKEEEWKPKTKKSCVLDVRECVKKLFH